MNISKILLTSTVILAFLTTGCAIQPTGGVSATTTPDEVTLASATARGTQFGPSASAILGSVMDINGCGTTGKPELTDDPTIASSAEVRDQNGNVTYDLNASGSKVQKCKK